MLADWLPRNAPGIVALTLATVAISDAAGWLSWECFEVHFHRLKRLFPVEKAHAWRPHPNHRAQASPGRLAA